MTWLLDLDGVVWRAERALPGAPEAIGRLRQQGQRVVFVTNNSSGTVGEYLAKLDWLGIPTDAADLLTSAQAAAAMLEPGSTALVCAGPGVHEALDRRGVRTVLDGDADVVVVGWHRDFNYARLTAAFLAVDRGARLLGTNDDATYPMEGGLVPGGGAILAAVAFAAGVAPEVAGKPHEPMAALVAGRAPDARIMVGDRSSTDGLLARRLGVPFALVLSGVTGPGDLPVDPEPDEVAADLQALVAQKFGL
ncbi:MAG: HAD-IIA family hydrolase [Acidimicrobiales bacterium]